MSGMYILPVFCSVCGMDGAFSGSVSAALSALAPPIRRSGYDHSGG